MRHEATSLAPPFATHMGVFSILMFAAWLLALLIDLLGLRASPAPPLNYLWLGGILWLCSIAFALPSLLFRLRFQRDALQFRWVGRCTRELPYATISRFELSPRRGLCLFLPDEVIEVYWVDAKQAAALLRKHGVPTVEP